MKRDCWTHIILEGYCMFSTLSKKTWTGYKCLTIIRKKNGKMYFKHEKPSKYKNKLYVPERFRPGWCKSQTPGVRCLYSIPTLNNQLVVCPFLAICPADKKDERIMLRAWKTKI